MPTNIFFMLITKPLIVLIVTFSAMIVVFRGYGQMLSPEILTYAYSSPNTRNANVEVWMLEPHTGRTGRYLALPSWARNYAWSADLQHIFFTQSNGDMVDLVIMEHDGDIQYQQRVDFSFDMIRWAPDGESLVVRVPTVEMRGGYYLLRLGQDDSLTFITEVDQLEVAWSDDGRFLYYMDYENGYIVRRRNIETGEIEAFSPKLDYPRIGTVLWSPDRQWISFLVRFDILNSLYVMKLDQTTEPPLGLGGYFPRGWSIDSNQLIYSVSGLNSALFTLDLANIQQNQLSGTLPTSSVLTQDAGGDWYYVEPLQLRTHWEIFRLDQAGKAHRLTYDNSVKWQLSWWEP